MVNDKLHISDLKRVFADTEIISTSDIVRFYQHFQPDVPRSTVNWRVYELVSNGVLVRIGKGKFTLPNIDTHRKKSFIPIPGKKIERINALIKGHFPLISYCIWDASVINDFSRHISNVHYILVDCERDATESVFYKLKEIRNTVFHKPTTETLEWYVTDFIDPVIVRPLVSEAPVQIVDEVPTVTLEKLLVDVYADREFQYLKGNEYAHIFSNAIKRYSCNTEKLLRYARRKGKEDELKSYINL